MQSLKKIQRTFFGYGSPSPERDESGRVIRILAKSPPRPTPEELQRRYAERETELAIVQAQQEEMNQASMIIEAMQFRRDEEVNEIITSLNEYLYIFFREDVNVDIEAPNIRYFVGMIVTSNRARQSVAEVGQSVAKRLARSKPLLRAVANFIVNRATTGATGLRNQVRTLLPIISNGLVNVGTFLGRVGMATGTAAYGAMSSVASGAMSRVASGARYYFSSEPQPVHERAASPQRGMQSIASHAYESITTGLHLFYRALSSVLGRVSSLLLQAGNSLLQCGAKAASVAGAGVIRAFGAGCTYFTPQQAVDQAVNRINEQNYECSICMTDAIGTDALLTKCKHRFHTSCIGPWLVRNTTCPNCRQLAIPTSSAQDGGGLKKYRSKSKSKHNSKTRRLRKSRSKPRKSYKSRKPRSSSRRK
jgi:hypothetical protein